MLPANKKTELQTEKYDEQKKIPSKGKKNHTHSTERTSFFYRFSPVPRTYTHTEEKKRKAIC